MQTTQVLLLWKTPNQASNTSTLIHGDEKLVVEAMPFPKKSKKRYKKVGRNPP